MIRLKLADLLFILLLPFSLLAQLAIDLPSSVEIFINAAHPTLTEGWMDSLVEESRSGKLHYNIAGTFADEHTVRTYLRIPQILSLNRVFCQVIFYYSLISEETDRIREQVFIFPYFSNMQEFPAMSCTYRSQGKFYFTITRWQVVPVPPQPNPEERDIFNQIIEVMLGDIQKMGSVAADIFKQIAEKNKLPVNEVRRIYENTILWQEAQ